MIFDGADMRQSWKSWSVLFGALILACLPLTAPAAPQLVQASRLDAEARQAAKAGGPLIILYSRADCSFCKTIKRDFLGPLAVDPRYAGRVVVREVAQDSNATRTNPLDSLPQLSSASTIPSAFLVDNRMRFAFVEL